MSNQGPGSRDSGSRISGAFRTVATGAARQPDGDARSTDSGGFPRRPRVAVVIFPGSNCDRDALAAVESAGGEAVPVWHESTDLLGCGAVILPGGFSYGDYLRAGAMAAHSPVMKVLRRHAEGGAIVLGICNGFQMLLEVGMLPGAMLMNQSLRFICRDVHVRVERDDLPLLKYLKTGQVLRVPIAHKEGNWYAAPDVVEAVEADGAVALRYCTASGQVVRDANPNGALHNIAGLVNKDGNVFGMMPHPERRMAALIGGEDGRALLRALVEAA